MTDTSRAKSSVFEVSTRDHFDEFGDPNVGNLPYESFDFEPLGCPQEVVVYVHGVWTGSGKIEDRAASGNEKIVLDNATEIFHRARLSLDSLGYSFPIVGFSWDSDTELSLVGWEAAKKIAKENGPKLAQFIIDLEDYCNRQVPPEDIDIRLIGHSLGSRVILSTLDNLAENENWNGKLTSVNLMGAAVDNEEVSKNHDDVIDSRGIKSAYGTPIENVVLKFYNLVNTEDDVLEPGSIQYWWWTPVPFYSAYNYDEDQPVYYPYFEQDLSLGQDGIQSDIPQIDRPRNYIDIPDIDRELINFPNANGDVNCDLINPLNGKCTITGRGDNHLGYAGFVDESKRLIDNGTMDAIVTGWRTN